MLAVIVFAQGEVPCTAVTTVHFFLRDYTWVVPEEAPRFAESVLFLS